MCGVVGFLSPVGMTPSTAARQAALAALRHRGPDGSGEDLIDCGMHQLWLGHRRLAIQDLSEAGAQPMPPGASASFSIGASPAAS